MSQQGSPNVALQRARLALRSQSGSGRPLSRQELADAVAEYLYRTYRLRVSIDRGYVGKLERGVYRWPSDRYREAFREILGASSDRDLGFYIVREPQLVIPGADEQTTQASGRQGAISLAAHWLDMLGVVSGWSNDRGATAVAHLVATQARLLDEQRRALHRPDPALMRAQARWCELASWAADNDGRNTDAQQWLARAFSLAQEAGDTHLASYVLMRQAQQAAELGHAIDAVDLAIKARRLFDMPSERTSALAYVRQAHGHALLGDAFATGQAFAAAGKALASSAILAPNDLDGHCTPQYVAAYEGYCQLILGEPTTAVRLLAEVLDEWPAGMRQDEAMWRAWLAQAHAASGELAEAGDEGLRALEVASAIQSARAHGALRNLAASVNPTTGPNELRVFSQRFCVAGLSGSLP